MKMFLQQNNYNPFTTLIAHNGKQWPTTSTCDDTLWLSRTTDNSNFFIGSREVRDNERRLYFAYLLIHEIRFLCTFSIKTRYRIANPQMKGWITCNFTSFLTVFQP